MGDLNIDLLKTEDNQLSNNVLNYMFSSTFTLLFLDPLESQSPLLFCFSVKDLGTKHMTVKSNKQIRDIAISKGH